METYLNRALSSEKPAARASTAAGVPIFRRANMARYRWNRGRFLLIRSFCRSSTTAADTASGFGVPDSKPEVGGAGSMEVYSLSRCWLKLFMDMQKWCLRYREL